MFREFPRPQRFRVKKGLTAEQGHEADCRQPTLRSGSRQRLMSSVSAVTLEVVQRSTETQKGV
jgi:hypothetical protein